MNVLDLFSGIGGFSLGLERAGMRTVAFCEIDPYCRAVLRRHWPDVPVYDDVRTLRFDRNANDENEHGCSINDEARPRMPKPSDIDLICGGFPCQDISVAGKGAGLGGERSGLWSEYARIIGEVRPRYAIIENVSALLSRGLGDVLCDLAALGFDAEWHCIPASAVGAPHRRDRVWIVAHANIQPAECRQSNGGKPRATEWDQFGGCGAEMAHADQPRPQGWLGAELLQRAGECAAGSGGSQWDEQRWFAQSGMGRVSYGTANRVDRLRALGNSVVPQIPEIIGRAIMSAQP